MLPRVLLMVPQMVLGLSLRLMLSQLFIQACVLEMRHRNRIGGPWDPPRSRHLRHHLLLLLLQLRRRQAPSHVADSLRGRTYSRGDLLSREQQLTLLQAALEAAAHAAL